MARELLEVLRMQIFSLAQRTVVSCTDRDTLEHVAQLMWKHELGWLPVLGDDGKVVGTITDRDVCVAAFLQAAPLRSITVSSIMAKEVVTCRMTTEVHDVIEDMIERRIRRVPVVDDNGHLIAVIALYDIARGAMAGALPTVDLAAIFVAINTPRFLPSAA